MYQHIFKMLLGIAVVFNFFGFMSLICTKIQHCESPYYPNAAFLRLWVATPCF